MHSLLNKIVARIFAVGLLLTFISFLLPNKIIPWISFWNEMLMALAFVLIACVFIGNNWKKQISLNLFIFLIIFIIAIVLQWIFNIINFTGDAWIGVIYLFLFFLSIVVGNVLSQREWSNYFLWTLFLSGVASSAIATIQWLGVGAFGDFIQILPPGGRPYGNLGQPNHLSTLCFIALCSGFQLYRQDVLNRAILIFSIILFSFVMTLTQSRTGVLQSLCLFIFTLWIKKENKKYEYLFSGGNLLLGLFWWNILSWLYDVLSIPGGVRDIVVSGSSGRLEIWRTFLSAVLEKPLFGWGWLQTAWAQQSVTNCHPISSSYFNYTHFLPLDFIIWFGLPLGLFFCGLIIYWLLPYLRRDLSSKNDYWLLIVFGFLIHTLLEYPLAYLYFLLPFGVTLGIIERKQYSHKMLTIPSSALIISWILLVILLIFSFFDVVRASSAYSEARFSEARILSYQKNEEILDLILFNQLESFVHLRSTKAEFIPDEETLELAKKVAQREPQPWVLMRYAQLLALAGKQEESRKQQQILCDINNKSLCSVFSEIWEEWRNNVIPKDFKISGFEGRVLTPRCQ